MMFGWFPHIFQPFCSFPHRTTVHAAGSSSHRSMASSWDNRLEPISVSWENTEELEWKLWGYPTISDPWWLCFKIQVFFWGGCVSTSHDFCLVESTFFSVKKNLTLAGFTCNWKTYSNGKQTSLDESATGISQPRSWCTRGILIGFTYDWYLFTITSHCPTSFASMIFSHHFSSTQKNHL